VFCRHQNRYESVILKTALPVLQSEGSPGVWDLTLSDPSPPAKTWGLRMTEAERTAVRGYEWPTQQAV
jgi:hypothetical protein